MFLVFDVVVVLFFCGPQSHVRLSPPPPCIQCCGQLVSAHVLFLMTRRLCPLPSHHLGIPILNLEGGGEVPDCIMMWLVLLVHFGGAKFCPSTVDNMCIWQYAFDSLRNLIALECYTVDQLARPPIVVFSCPAGLIVMPGPPAKRRARRRLPRRRPYRKLSEDEIRLAKMAQGGWHGSLRNRRVAPTRQVYYDKFASGCMLRAVAILRKVAPL